MAFCDFVVKYNPEKDTLEDLTKRILYSIIIKRIKHKKPAIMFIGGDSGEGKSLGAIRLEELLLSIQGLSINDFFNDINVYTPLQYPEKQDALLFEKRLKKANIICLHEAREIIKSKDWQRFLAQAVADVNAMSRTVKRLVVIIISQFIRDITKDMRYTLNYYCIIRRPKGKRSRLYINVLWKDDRDLEAPKLRKRKLSGYLQYPNGVRRRFIPTYLEMKLPNKSLIEKFEQEDLKAKSGIIKHKLNKLLSEIKGDLGQVQNKVISMVEWYISNPETLHLIGKRYKGKFKVKKEVREMHNLTRSETDNFEIMLNQKLKEQGVISP